jgi:hypothetical protein
MRAATHGPPPAEACHWAFVPARHPKKCAERYKRTGNKSLVSTGIMARQTAEKESKRGPNAQISDFP